MKICYDIFKKCFENLKLSEKLFYTLLGKTDKVFYAETGTETVGFAAVRENNLRLICVLPMYRKTGYGKGLFEQCAEYVKSRGFDTLKIGGTDSGLFIGAVRGSEGFFEKMGCSFYDTVAEMYGETDKLTSAPPCDVDNITFGFFEGNRERLYKAVGEVDDDWVQYFNDGEVFCAFAGDEVASFCIIDKELDCLFSDGKSRFGNIGCVGTVPKFRRHGTGLETVSRAAKILTEIGCDRIFIHYTAVYDWYAKLGFKTGIMLSLGEYGIMGKCR